MNVVRRALLCLTHEKPRTPPGLDRLLRRQASTSCCRSASLIPDEMSTTLFTIAGWSSSSPSSWASSRAPAPRAVTVQRCLRVAGAKSDIENVGRTGRHGTFLEMLGNFSFGDYYKTRGDRVRVGVRHRTCSSSIPRDSTSPCTPATMKPREIWERRGRARRVAHHALRRRQLLDDGPDRPVRSVHRDLLRYRRSSMRAGPNDTGPNLGNRYVEIWNVVFQQYNRGADGKLTELPRKSIDTGAGLERMLAVCNGKASMYETDLFTDLIAAQPPVAHARRCTRRSSASARTSSPITRAP